MSVAQLPLALRSTPDQRFESFIDPPDGLIKQLQTLASVRGTDWVYLVGTHGTGKTHLALATCWVAQQAGHHVSYVPLMMARGAVAQLLEGQEAFSLVVLDALEVIAGSRDDEVAVFDFHNRMRAAGHAMLYTANALPDEIGLVLPDLCSRLQQCSRTALPLLDDAGRAAVLRERARRRGLVLEPAATDWLLVHTGRELEQLIRLLDRLDHASLVARRRVTVPFLKQVLGKG